VVANPNALEFYVRAGFAAEVDVATRFGPGLRMKRRLDRVRGS
jgi:hypothetical protein